jgi:hypothetical protein
MTLDIEQLNSTTVISVRVSQQCRAEVLRQCASMKLNLTEFMLLRIYEFETLKEHYCQLVDEIEKCRDVQSECTVAKRLMELVNEQAWEIHD